MSFWEAHRAALEQAVCAEMLVLVVSLERLEVVDARGDSSVLGRAAPAELTGLPLAHLEPERAAGFPFRAQLVREPGRYRELYVSAGTDGRTMPVELRVVHLEVPGGHALVLMRSAVDASAAAAELHHLHLQLSEAYRELKHQQAALNEARRAASLSLFAAGLAHELNNPVGFALSTARSLAQLAQETRGGGSAQDAEDMVEMGQEIVQGLERVAAVVRLLGELENRVQRSPFRLASVLEAVADEFRATVQCAPELEVESDAGALRRLLQKLLHNARRAAGAGGRVSLVAGLEAQDVVVTVEDGGPGVPADVRERVFDPFFTTLPAGQALGLGLFLARRGAAALGGSVGLDPAAVHGARVWVRFPQRLPDGFLGTHASYEAFRVGR